MAWTVKLNDHDIYVIYDDEGWYVASCRDEHRAKLISSAPGLASALHELLWEMDAIAHHEFETDHVRACQKARKLLGLLGMWGPPQKEETKT